jgi:hypothetical protein
LEIFEKLKSLSLAVPKPLLLPTENDLKRAEEKLGITFPPSYSEFQLKYSDLNFGTFEPYHLFEDGSYKDIFKAVQEARDAELPNHLFPFLEDNGDYYCFDLTSTPPEYEVKYWSHNGYTNERWPDFINWIEKCWIGENI